MPKPTKRKCRYCKSTRLADTPHGPLCQECLRINPKRRAKCGYAGQAMLNEAGI